MVPLHDASFKEVTLKHLRLTHEHMIFETFGLDKNDSAKPLVVRDEFVSTATSNHGILTNHLINSKMPFLLSSHTLLNTAIGCTLQ